MAFWRKELRGRLTYWRLMGTGVASVAWLLLTSASDVRRFRKPQASDERYARPERRYDLPADGVTPSTSPSRERYLRPTRYCNPRAPEVVALAHALAPGVFRTWNLPRRRLRLPRNR